MQESIDIGKGTLTKSELRDQYNISRGTLQYLLNIRYYDQLKEVGYKKFSKILSPQVVSKFKEIYGDPL